MGTGNLFKYFFKINIILFGRPSFQFLDHDVTHTPLAKGEDGDDLKCCSSGGRAPLTGDLRHPECHPIDVLILDTSRFPTRFLKMHFD